MTMVRMALALTLLALPPRAGACTCVPVTAAENFRRSAKVFVGRVVRQEHRRVVHDDCVPSRDAPIRLVPDPDIAGFCYAPELRVTFEVERAWKGVSQPFVTIRNDTGDCPASLEMGRLYLVYASRAEDDIFTAHCSRPAPVEPWPADRQTAAADEASFGAPAYDPVTDYERARDEHVAHRGAGR